MPDRLVLFIYESWKNLDGSVEGLNREEATTQHGGGSSIAWTIGHVTNMVDSWINVNFQGLAPHPFISGHRFRAGGTGECCDWEEVLAATHEICKRARKYLDSGPPIDQVIPYNGSVAFLRETGLRLSYALMRISAHHFIHAGEIVTVRSRLGDTLTGSPPRTGVGHWLDRGTCGATERPFSATGNPRRRERLIACPQRSWLNDSAVCSASKWMAGAQQLEATLQPNA